MQPVAPFAPGTLGLPCKVAVDLETGAWEIVGTARTWMQAKALTVPARLEACCTFETVEGLAQELAQDVYEIGHFEGPPVPQEDRL